MEGAQTIWLCRHGERMDSVDRAFGGPDPILSELGLVQAEETGARLRGEHIRRIFTSPFLRAVQTADGIAEALDLPLFIERGFGEWLNPEWFSEDPPLAIAPLLRHFRRIDASHTSVVTPTLPETGDVASRRSGEAALTIAARHPNEDLLFVGHGHSVIGMALALLGAPVEADVSYCGLFKITRGSQGATLEFANDTGHLSRLQSA